MKKIFTCAPGCPVELTAMIIGGKWKAVILFHLISGPKRFGELQRLVPGTTQRMLTLQLRELEANQIVHREVYPTSPLRVEYSLTPWGEKLKSLIQSMFYWGIEYNEDFYLASIDHHNEL